MQLEQNMTSALIVIDVQNDFCPGGALAVSHGDGIVAPINAMMAGFNLCVLTQDWHPKDHASFASNHAGAADFSMTTMTYGPQVLWPDHCVQSTDGAAFHPMLDLTSADLILRKGKNSAIDSYSAFFENDRKTTTGLAGYLHARAVERVVLVGLATDYCVAYSAVDAATLGFQVQVDLRACCSINLAGSLTKAMTQMQQAGVEFKE